MKKTRNLFILNGNSDHVSNVLNDLQFKGLITIPYGTSIVPSTISEAFENNKSVVCSTDDYFASRDPSASLPEDILVINVVTDELDFCRRTDGIIKYTDGNFAKNFANLADMLNCDIGDHKSNSSGLNGTPTIADCAYCRYLAGYPADNERTVYKSENFFVIPTVGEFITGYLLIIPFNHIMSNAELSKDLLDEFVVVLEDIEYLIKLTYGAPSVLVWENGSGSCGVGKAKDSIVHSHVHICPSKLTSETIGLVMCCPFEEITLDDLKRYKEHSYLLIRTPDYKFWKINNNPKLYIPRQFVRQLVAEEYGLTGESWNWRTHPFSQKMYQTVEDIRKALQQNWNNIPERIKKRTEFLI